MQTFRAANVSNILDHLFRRLEFGGNKAKNLGYGREDRLCIAKADASDEMACRRIGSPSL